ncbi:MAG TPA: hypothetical protein VGQ83_04755 [Polyangia bacterium]|jgi:hypothetical protein
MTTRLSSLLVQEGLVSVKRMEEAFQRQVIYGGSLDTILLEMRVIDEPRLVAFLAQATGLAAAEPAEIFTVDQAALRLCPRDRAESAFVAPLGITDGVLRLLVTDPVDRARLDELGFHLGVGVEPRIAPECRLYQAWNLRYGAAIPARYATLAARLAAPEAGRAAAPEAVTEPRMPTRSEPPAAAPAPSAAPRPEASPLSLEAATERVANAANRDEIFDAFVRAARSRLEFVALFTVQGTHAHGRVALSRDGAADLSQVSLRLEGDSALASASRSAAPYLGPPGADLTNDACFAALGRPRPATMVIVPVVIRGRAVALLYGDRGHRSIPAAQVVDLFTLGHEVGRAFSRLIMKAKGALYAPATDSAGQLGAAAVPEPVAAGPWGPAPAGNTARFIAVRPPATDADADVAPTEPMIAARAPRGEDAAPEDVVAAAAAEAVTEAAPVADAAAGTGAGTAAEAAAGTATDTGADAETQAAAETAAGTDADADADAGRETDAAADAERETDAAADAEREPAGAPAAAELDGVVPEPAPPFDGHAGPAEDAAPAAALEVADTERLNVVADPWSHPEEILELDAEMPPPPALPEPEPVGLEVVAELPSGRVSLAPDVMHWLDGNPAAGTPLPARTTPQPVGTGITVVSPREIDGLLDEIERAPESAEAHVAAAALERMGEPALEVMVRRFPGRLRCDRYALKGKLPPVGEHSELLRILIDCGRPAVRHVLRLLGSPDLDVRFYATYLFSELVFAEVVPALATRLYDPDASVRGIAVEVLRRYLATAEMKEVLERARGELPGPDPQRQRYAAEALGELRDVASVPRLIELTKHRDDAIAEAARRALVLLTKQDFGASQRQWRGWWDKNRTRHRVEWLLEGLGHGDAEIRLSASEELRRLTHQHFGYHFDLPKREREEARQKWLAWWEQTGRRSVGGERA